jgi:hypothetical protein
MKEKRKNSWLKTALIGLCAAALMFGLSTGSVLAQDKAAEVKLSPEEQKECDECEKKAAEKKLPPHQRPAPAEPGGPKGNQHGSLAEAATNPLANLIQFQLQNQYNSVVDNSGTGASNEFLIQPVVPFSLPWKWMPTLITRTTLPYISTTDLGFPIGREYGFSDTTLLLVGNIPIAKGQMIGVGASLVFPTGGSNEILSSGKWQAGPAWAYINTMFKGWQLGAFGFQHWDYANGPGGGKKPYVSNHSVQPLIVKHFGKGWYVRLQDIPWKYDFRTDDWSMPTGPAVGKVFKLGKLPLNAFTGVYYDPMTHNDASSNTWSFKVNLTVLFPK